MVKSKVTTFHKMPAKFQGRYFIVVPLDMQKGSLEFSMYKDIVDEKLELIGLVKTSNVNDANYVVTFNYGIDSGTTSTGSIPTYGQTGGGTTYQSGNVYSGYNSASYSGTSYTPATFGQTGSIPYSSTSYTRQFNLKIYDNDNSTEENIVTIYEGRVVSVGSTGEISVVLPTLIESMFIEFPGKSGKTKTVTRSLNKTANKQE